MDYADFEPDESTFDRDYTIVDVSKLGTDIVVEYNIDYGDWDSKRSVLLTMKKKPKVK